MTTTGPSHADPRAAFSAAVREDRVDDARRLLLRNSEVRATLHEPVPGGDFGAKPLLAAVERKNRGMVDLLVSAGADINGLSDWWPVGSVFSRAATPTSRPF